MEKYKKIRKSLITLLLAAALALGTAIFAVAFRPSKVYAADRTVELDGNSVFYTALRTAEITHTGAVKAEELDIPEDSEEENPTACYTLFKLETDEEISYRQNLAYTWKTAAKDDDGNALNYAVDNYFSIKLSFNKLNFKRFIIKFQSQQYVCTKEGRSENYLVFEPILNGERFALKVAQSLDEYEEGEHKGELKDFMNVTDFAKDERVEIALYLKEDRATRTHAAFRGDYQLIVNGNEYEIDQVSFKNISGSYASYVASGDYAVTPMTFYAQDIEDGEAAEMVLYSISGQSFKMHDQGNDSYKIIDTAAPVMCFRKTPSYLEYGKSIGLGYTVIDVLASSPRATAYYYVLSGEQYAKADYEYDRTDYSEKSDSSSEEEGEEKPEPQKDPFTQLSSSSSARIIRDADSFVPTDYDASGNKTDKYDNVYGLVKLYYEISDVSGSYKKTDKVFVDWYAVDETGAALDALVDIYEIKGESDPDGLYKRSYFLKLIDGKDGLSYATKDDLNATDAEAAYKQTVGKIAEDYQKKITAAVAGMKYDDENTEDGKLYAGGEKFYLPAFEYDFEDEYSINRDYKYSIYYRGKSTSSSTSLDSNKLAIDLNDADVTYTFTIIVADAMGNPMRYPAKVDDGEGFEWKEISSSDIWTDEYSELLPFFTFEVSYKPATAETPKKLSLSYVGSSYSGVNFDIKGVSGTYTADYNLYIFDRDAMADVPSSEIVKNIEALMNNTYEEGVNTYKYFTTVKNASDLLEADANYDLFKKINWNSSGVSFTPQSVNDLYVVELTLTDNASQEKTYKYAVLAPSVQTTALKGESDWVENNLTSIILLCVAGVCFIALIALLIIKPKDKGDIDAVYTEVAEKSEKKSKKAKSNK